MKRSTLLYTFTGLGVLIFGIAAIMISQSGITKPVKYNKGFDNYLTAYTSGAISRKSPVMVRFQEALIPESKIGKTIKDNPFTFNPPIPGKAKWLDTRTIQFDPAQPLPYNQRFLAQLDVDALMTGVPDSLKTFHFDFYSKKQFFTIDTEPLKTLGEGQIVYQKLRTKVWANDFIESEEVEKIVSARLDNKRIKLKWEHKSDVVHYFTVDSIQRIDDPQELVIEWNASILGINQLGTKKIEVPALGSFNLISANSFNDEDQYIMLVFSDPIKKNQILDGIIEVPGYNIDWIVEGNSIKVFPKETFGTNITVKVDRNLKNIDDKKLISSSTSYLSFELTKPQVRLVGKGTIVPQSRSLPFVFEAVGLNAVDVQVVKIHEKNIPQFLQVNYLNGSDELRRVGEIITQQKVDLNYNKKLNLNNWNKHVIDLSELVKTEPGAIYQVNLGFRRSYSTYPCSEEAHDSYRMFASEESWDEEEAETSYWDNSEYLHEWRGSEDPCDEEYYHSGHIVSRNILGSNIGIIAKGADDQYFIATTDINTTAPLSGVEIEFYNYQQRKLENAVTNDHGIARIKSKVQPYLIVAKHGRQRGYLKLDPSNALSLSRFDINGQRYKKGLKGFIYAERGVWRPGDEIHLNFILEDKEKSLPYNHPVKLELYDPNDHLVHTQISKKSINGFYTFPLSTEENAPTGNYWAKVHVGGSTFEKKLKVETIVPNRLKIELGFPGESLDRHTNKLTGDLKVNWLHGAVGANLKADVSVSLSQIRTSFKTFNGYTFDDPSRMYYSGSNRIFDGVLDENGTAKVPATISVDGTSSGMMRANFITKVYEPGGNFSTDRFHMTFHPYDTYVGIKVPKGDKARGMLLTDVDHKIKVVTVDKAGEIKKKRRVEMQLYKLSWKWWWDEDKDDLSYFGRNHTEALLKDTVITTNGEAEWKLNVAYPQWGRFLIRAVDEDGHACAKIVYIDWPGWAGRGQKESGGGGKMLSFSTEKAKYNVGDKITLNIPTGFAGRALVSIESGGKVIEAHWVHATKGMTKFTFRAKQNMAPAVYAYVTLLQPHAQTANDLPIRMYGVIPIYVHDPNTKLHPVIKMADEIAPESKARLQIKEQNGKAMTYTVAIVDEGLLGLTRFQTPDAWQHFNQREALRVTTWDLFDDVAGAEGRGHKNLLAIGGGDYAGKEGSKQNRFKPMVRYLGPFHLGPGKTNTHYFDVPNYVGQVRTMVIAGNKGSYGKAQKQTFVRKPLMVLASPPRILGPNEEITLPVTVFAMDSEKQPIESLGEVSVEIETNHLLQVIDPEPKKVSFKKTGDKMVFFKLKAKPSIGNATIKVKVSGASIEASYEKVLEVRASNPPITDFQKQVINPGNSWNTSFKAFGIEGTNKGVVEVSSVPPLNLGKRLKYLIRYPYGCVEQTTSSVFPQVYLPELMPMTDKSKSEVTKNIKAGIARLLTFQRPSGGLSYWPGGYDESEWGTNYAGHFMLEAKAAGYQVPDDFLNKWSEFQKKRARNWSTNGDKSNQSAQAYRLYLLALNGTPELGAMNRFRLTKEIQSVASWYLAAAYHLVGQKEVASDIVKKLNTKVVDYKEMSGSYGSKLRDEAIILQCLSLMEMEEKAMEQAQLISNQLNSQEWYSTQTTAYSLVAMSKFIGNKLDSPMDFSYRLRDGNWHKVTSNKPIWQFNFDIEDLRSQQFQFKNNSGKSLYAKLLLEGVPETGNEKPASNNLEIDVDYFDLDGNALDITQLEQGTDFKATVKVHNPSQRDYEEMALDHIFPAGWEIHNDRFDGSANTSSTYDYRDIRDDRVYTFFDLKAGDTKRFEIKLNATYLGKFYLPGVYSDAMYDHTINANVPGTWIQVIENNLN